MTTLKSNVIEPSTGTDLSLGAAGDLIEVSNDALQLNTWKDSGGNTLFTSDGAGNVSSVKIALAAGGPNLISTQTVSGATTLDFTSGIDNTYDKYMFVWLNVNPGTNVPDFGFQGSTDGGSNYNTTMTTTTWRAYKKEADNSNEGVAYATGQDQAQGTGYQAIGHYLSNATGHSTSGILYIFAPSNTTYVKHFYSRGATVDGSAATHINDWFSAGYFNTASAINAISFKMTSGNFDGKIAMYGCR